VAQSKILLDSNSYFRLARSIHPLLLEVFGDQEYCLYALRELQDEYDRQPRLKSKFPWVDEPEYRSNRNKSPTLSKKQKRELATVFDFMWDHVVHELPGPSRVDVRILTHGYVLEIPVATDDIDMHKLANVFGVKVLKTLELLKLMLDADHVSIEKIRQIAAFWTYENDEPADHARDFRRLFGESAPG